MTKRCGWVHGAHLCGRAAKAKLAVVVPPHRGPARYLCVEHAVAWTEQLWNIDQDVEVERIEL